MIGLSMSLCISTSNIPSRVTFEVLNRHTDGKYRPRIMCDNPDCLETATVSIQVAGGNKWFHHYCDADYQYFRSLMEPENEFVERN